MKYILFILLYVVSLNANAWSIGDGADITELKNGKDNLLSRTSGLKGRTEDTLTKVEDMSTIFRKSLKVISGDLSDKVRYGIEDIDQILEMQREGLSVFLGVNESDILPIANSTTDFDFTPPSDRQNTECLFGSPCFQFREELKNTLAKIKDLGAAVIGVNSNPTVNLNINFDKYIDLVDRVPGRALYPIYSALISGGADTIDDLQVLLNQAIIDVQFLSGIALSEITGTIPPSPNNSEFPQLQYDAKGCQNVIDFYTPYVLSKEGLSNTGRVMKVFGKFFIANGKTVLKETGLSGGWAEFADIEIEIDGNFQDSLGNALDGLGDTSISLSDSFEQKIDYCASLRAQLNILENQQQILLALSNLQASSDTGNTDDPITVADNGDAESSPTGGGGSSNLQYLALLLVTIICFRFIGGRSSNRKRIN